MNEINSNINISEKELEPYRLRYKAIDQKIKEITELQLEIKNDKEKLSDLKDFQSMQEEKERHLLAEIKSNRDVLHKLKKQIKDINNKKNILQLLLDCSRNNEVINRLALDIT